MKNSFLIGYLLLMSILLFGCSPSSGSAQGAAELEGTITISGAWAIYPMMVRWTEEFQAIYPDVRFDFSAGGAGKGMADAVSGTVDIGMVSREIHTTEIEQGACWISVTRDAVFLTVNEDNPVWEDLHQSGVTEDILYDIYITGEITTWGQVVNHPEIKDPIHVFTRSDACGAAETWAQFLGGRQEDLLGIGVYGDPGVLDAVIKDPLGIGFNNLNYVYDFDTGQPIAGARVVPLDVNANGMADIEEIYDRKELAVDAVALDNYPSPPARDLNLVTLGHPVGLVKTFLTWILTDGQQYVDEVGYIPLPSDRLLHQLNELNE